MKKITGMKSKFFGYFGWKIEDEIDFGSILNEAQYNCVINVKRQLEEELLVVIEYYSMCQEYSKSQKWMID